MTVLYQVILITIIFPSLIGLPVSSNIFNASITTKCPSNTTSYEDARSKKNCTGNTRYMCAPYKDLSYLLEYCTSTRRSLFIKGNCLALQDSGYLDTIECNKTFVNGCPNTSFFDENLYKFPTCISINTDQKCFIAEKNCSTPKRKDISTESTPRTTETTKSDSYIIFPVVLTVLMILFVSGCIISFVIWKRRKANRSRTEDSVPSLEGSTDTAELFERARKMKVPVYFVKGYVVGCSGQNDDLLGCLRHVKYISLEPEHLKPIFPSPHTGTSLKRTKMKFMKRTSSQTKNQGSLQGSEGTEPMLSGSDVHEGNEQKQHVLKVFKDFLERPSHTNKVLNLRDFSGKIDSFALQQTSLCKDVFYIFAVDMAQKLDETSEGVIGGRRWRKVRDYYAQWMDIMMINRKKREEDCSLIFVATNAEDLSLDARQEYFAELWEMYEHKFGKRIDESLRQDRECVLQRKHPNNFQLRSKDHLCHCVETLLKENYKWGIQHPLVWGVIEHFILQKRETCSMMSREKLFEFCYFLEEPEFNEMLVYLNHIGLVVCVDEEPLRNNIILNVGWFWNAVEKFTDTHYFQSKHGHDAKHFLETGLLTFREFNEILKGKEDISKQCQGYLQSLGMLANFTETSKMDEAIYIPCMNKKVYDDISQRYRQSSILCFRFKFLPACLFHRVVVFCIEKMNWEVCTDKYGKYLYDTAATFNCQNHHILIGLNGNVIEARVFIIDTMFIDSKLSADIKKGLEDFLKKIKTNIYPTNMLEVGYRCKVLAKFCDPKDSSFVTEEQLCNSNYQQCPKCSKKYPHSIQADRILGFWNEDSVRAPSKGTDYICSEKRRFENIGESLKEEDEGELTSEDYRVTSRIRTACKEGTFTQFEHERNRYPVKKLLDKGFLHKHDKHGNTILHLAAEGGSCEIFTELVKIDEKTDVFEKTEIGHTVLHIACKNAKSKMCVYLLSHYPALLHMETNRRWNASHFAAWGGDVEIMQHLKEKGLDLSLKNSNGCSILHIAAKYNRYEMCEYIVKNHSELLTLKTEDGLNAAHYAAKRCNSKLLQLFQNDLNILEQTKSRKTILHIACEIGDTTFFNYVVGISTPILKDVDDEGWNALHFSAKGGNVDIAKELVEREIQPGITFDGKTILHIACNYNRYEMCLYITKRFHDLIKECNPRGWNAAHYVVVEPKENDDSFKVLKLLFNVHVDLHKVTKSGNTILTLAYYHKNTRIIKHLLQEYPSLLNIPSGKSLSDVVAEYKDQEIQILIEEAKELLHPDKHE